MTILHYIPLWACGPILKNLQDKTFDDIKQAYKVLKALEYFMGKKNLSPSDILTGLFILKKDKDTILSIAVVSSSKLDRIYTVPSERNKGYAQKLLHEIVTFGIKNNISYYSPVEEKVKDLFIKGNWIPVMNNEINKDLTIDYCHKVFHKKIIKTYPDVYTKINIDMIIAFKAIME